MPGGGMNRLFDSRALVSVTELAEIIDSDPTTIDNWLRRKIINRAPLAGRKLRNRMFSAEEVYKTALKHELVKLEIPPSSASEVVHVLWRQWNKKDVPEGRSIYALVLPSKDKWMVVLCFQKVSGGPLYEFGKSTGTMSREGMDLPRQAFAVIPISEVLDRASKKLSELLAR
jgi:hypothetical protein